MSKAKWTVMVLMGGNNVDGEIDLSACAKSDLAEMKQCGSKKDVLNIVVQIDDGPKEGGPRRIQIMPRGEHEVVHPLANGKGSSGDPSVLRDFLRWARKYPADHYLLVLWGHAYRLAFNRDPKNTEGLDFIRLAEEIDQTNTNGDKLDIVAFDSCNVSLIEAAYQLRNSARLMVASQFSDPLPGWPYKEILSRIASDPEGFSGHKGPKEFARLIVSQFVRHYTRKNHVTMTALDLSLLDQIPGALTRLSNELLSLLGDHDELAAFRDSFQRAQVPGPDEAGQPSVDLISLCWHLIHSSQSPDVAVAAAALSDLLFFPGDGNGSGNNPFVVAHARNDLVVAMLQGVSIFAPNVVSDESYIDLRSKYGQLELAKSTPWADLVFELAEPD
jgi:hypothetical protein